MPRTLGSRDVRRLLEQEGFVLQRQTGSHMVFRHTDGRVAIVPEGRRELPVGTLRSIWRQAGFGWPPR
jgi:predicted RNA binding protein YcfA (HicA-like mRNA interferase family)